MSETLNFGYSGAQETIIIRHLNIILKNCWHILYTHYVNIIYIHEFLYT